MKQCSAMPDPDKEIPMIQTIILTMEDGRVLTFIGPAGIKDGEIMKTIRATEPKPLPEGCYWEPIDK